VLERSMMAGGEARAEEIDKTALCAKTGTGGSKSYKGG